MSIKIATMSLLLFCLRALLLLLPIVHANVYLGPSSAQQQVNYVNFPAVGTAIEDHKCGCLFVATSPQNYAFCMDPHTNPHKWSSVSVNFHGDVYVTTAQDKRPITFQLASMNQSHAEFIEHTFQHYSQNLVFPALSPDVQLTTGAQQRQRRMFLPAPIARPYAHKLPPLAPALLYQPQVKPSVTPTNYFNIDQSPHNYSLLGDIYNFDLSGRILDIYSNSVSFHQGERSIVYRHPGFFSYSRPGLPININRFFVVGDFLLFVYQDGSVLAKPMGLLEQVEAAVVTEAKKEIGELLHLWPYQRGGDQGEQTNNKEDEAPDEAEEVESEAD